MIHKAACGPSRGLPLRSLVYSPDSSLPSEPITCQIRQRGVSALLKPRECQQEVNLMKRSPAVPEIGTAFVSRIAS